MSRAVLALAILLGFAIQPTHLQAQQDAVGSWEMSMETPRGTITQTFEFTRDGDVLSGTVTGPRGSTEPTRPPLWRETAQLARIRLELAPLAEVAPALSPRL